MAEELTISDVEREFAHYYVGPARFNVTAAARYVGRSPEWGFRTRKKQQVATHIENLCQQMCDRWLLSSQRWLAEVLSLGLSDSTDIIPQELNGEGVMVAKVPTLDTIKNLPPQVRSAIKDLTIKADGSVQVKMHPKEGPLRMLGEYMAILKSQGRAPPGDPPPEAEDEEAGVLLGLQMIGPGVTLENEDDSK